MIAFDRSEKQKIHTRQINVTTYEGTSGSIVVEGILKDERQRGSYLLTGEALPPGPLHHLIIRMEVTIAGAVIRDIEIEMLKTPNKDCIEMLNCLEPIKGMPIASGFTIKVKKLLDGIKGCTHLLALLTAMAPAAFQGAYSTVVSKPVDRKSRIPSMVKRLKNTCWVWREDGSLVKRLMNDLEADPMAE